MLSPMILLHQSSISPKLEPSSLSKYIPKVLSGSPCWFILYILKSMIYSSLLLDLFRLDVSINRYIAF